MKIRKSEMPRFILLVLAVALFFFKISTVHAEEIAPETLSAPPAPEIAADDDTAAPPPAAAAPQIPSGSIGENDSGNPLDQSFPGNPFVSDDPKPLPDLPEDVFATDPIIQDLGDKIKETTEDLNTINEELLKDNLKPEDAMDLLVDLGGELFEDLQNHAAWIDQYFEEHPTDPLGIRQLLENLQLIHDLLHNNLHEGGPLPDPPARGNIG